MTAVADLLAGSDQRFAYLLVIEALPYMWTTDGSGDLWGGGSGTWIGAADGRIVKPGLHAPPSRRLGLSLLDGQLEDNAMSFTLTDVDGSLADLFAKEPSPADVDVLLQDIEPNDIFTVDPDVAIQPLSSPQSTVDITSKHVGIEKISAAGGRSQWLPWPVTMPGRHHVVDAHEASLTPPVWISDDPSVFEGRRVALYRIMKDHHSGLSGKDAWPAWSVQHAGGALVWWGTLLDNAKIRANREWQIRCAGPESLHQGRVGENVVRDWLPVQASVDLDSTTNEDETKVAISIFSRGAALGGWYQSALWAQSLSGGTSNQVREDLSGFLTDVIDGTTVNVYGGQPTFASSDGTIRITEHLNRNAFELLAAESAEETVLVLAMHETAWQVLGFEPRLQATIEPNSVRHVVFEPLGTPRGTDIMEEGFVGGGAIQGVPGSQLVAPGPGYWVARLSTRPLHAAEDPPLIVEYDNDFRHRYLSAMNSIGASIVDPRGDQNIVLAGLDHLFVQGQLFLPPFDGTYDGKMPTETRLWLLRGKIQTDPAEEPRDLIQVAQMSWALQFSALGAGSVAVDIDANPILHLDGFRDPRLFGLDHKPLSRILGDGYWATHLEVLPLSTLAYTRGDRPEVRYLLLMRLLLSTGSSTGWSSQTAIDDGDNTPDASTRLTSYAADREIANLGLAVPAELVADESEFREAFDVVPGGWEGPMNRVRLAWTGAVSARDIVRSLMAPAGVAWRLHGGKYGVWNLYEVPSRSSVEVTLTIDDVEGPPSQESVTYGRFASVKLDHAWNPESSSLVSTFEVAARDRGAKHRPNDVERPLEDWGLPDLSFWDGIDGDTYRGVTGIDPWPRDFRAFWGTDVASFLSQRNFPVTCTVKPHKAHSIWPGTVVQITSPWLLNPLTGSYGVVNGVCRCIAIEARADGSSVVELLVYGESLRPEGQPHYSLIARSGRGYNPATRTLYLLPDWRKSGDGISDVQGAEEPSWSTLGGGSVLKCVEIRRNGTFFIGPTGTVESVDPDTNSITFAAPGLSGYRRDADYFIVQQSYGSSTTWAQSVLGVVTDPAGGNGAGTGKPWIE